MVDWFSERRCEGVLLFLVTLFYFGWFFFKGRGGGRGGGKQVRSFEFGGLKWIGLFEFKCLLEFWFVCCFFFLLYFFFFLPLYLACFVLWFFYFYFGRRGGRQVRSSSMGFGLDWEWSGLEVCLTFGLSESPSALARSQGAAYLAHGNLFVSWGFDKSHHTIIPPSQLPWRLILPCPSNRKLKPHPFPRKLLVYLGVRIKSEIHTAPLLLVQHHLEHFAPILTRPGALPYNLDGIHDIV